MNGNELHDNDIGFHIIDTQWAASPRIGLHYHATNKTLFSATSGFQMTFGRGSRLNFAGLQKDGTVKWNRKNFTDADVNVTIDETKITPETQHALPYRFSGLFFELGATINLR